MEAMARRRGEDGGGARGASAASPPPSTSVLVIPRPTADDAFRSGSPVELTKEMLKSKFDMRLSDAAKSLGISITSFKQVCRKLGLARWPRRLRPRPPRTGAHAASVRRAESDDDEDNMEEEAPQESRKRREPAAMRQAGPGTHAQALPSQWPAVNGGSKRDMPAFGVAGGDSCKRSRHTVRDADMEPYGLAGVAGEYAHHNAPSAPGAQPRPAAFAALSLPNDLSWGGLPSRPNQRGFGQTLDVGAGNLAMAAGANPFSALSDLQRPTAMSSQLPSASGLLSQQQQLMLASLQQSSLSPSVLLQQHTAAMPPAALQRGSQSVQALNEQILATKLQIATLEASRQQQAANAAFRNNSRLLQSVRDNLDAVQAAKRSEGVDFS
jgi:hypothetical protein